MAALRAISWLALPTNSWHHVRGREHTPAVGVGRQCLLDKTAPLGDPRPLGRLESCWTATTTTTPAAAPEPRVAAQARAPCRFGLPEPRRAQAQPRAPRESHFRGFSRSPPGSRGWGDILGRRARARWVREEAGGVSAGCWTRTRSAPPEWRSRGAVPLGRGARARWVRRRWGEGAERAGHDGNKVRAVDASWLAAGSCRR